MPDRPPGRPTRCTPEVTEAIAEYLSAGNFPAVASALAGVTERSFYNWKKKGEDEIERRDQGLEPDATKECYVQFFQSVTRADARAEAASVIRIRQIARGDKIDPRVRLEAEKFLLERRFRDRWGRTVVDVNHRGDISLSLNVPVPVGMMAQDEDEAEADD